MNESHVMFTRWQLIAPVLIMWLLHFSCHFSKPGVRSDVVTPVMSSQYSLILSMDTAEKSFSNVEGNMTLFLHINLQKAIWQNVYLSSQGLSLGPMTRFTIINLNSFLLSRSFMESKKKWLVWFNTVTFVLLLFQWAYLVCKIATVACWGCF